MFTPTTTKEERKMIKRLLCALAALTLLCGLIPAACAEETVTFSY